MITQITGGRICHIHKSHGSRVSVFLGTHTEGRESVSLIFQKVCKIIPNADFSLIAYECGDWNGDFSPWSADNVFGGEVFGGRGTDTLNWILRELIPDLNSFGIFTAPKERLLAGYSLAGLFSLWALYERPEEFCGAASCSGSLWFPNWPVYAESHTLPEESSVYLSLGRKEEFTRNAAMSTVGDATRNQYKLLLDNLNHNNVTLQWHDGGHFNNTDQRTAEGIAWLLKNKKFTNNLL